MQQGRLCDLMNSQVTVLHSASSSHGVGLDGRNTLCSGPCGQVAHWPRTRDCKRVLSGLFAPSCLASGKGPCFHDGPEGPHGRVISKLHSDRHWRCATKERGFDGHSGLWQVYIVVYLDGESEKNLPLARHCLWSGMSHVWFPNLNAGSGLEGHLKIKIHYNPEV